jgi:mRNA interferase RelE/StbE
MEKRYSIRFAESAARSLARLPAAVRVRVTTKIDALADNPHPTGTRKMKGGEHAYRLRVGDYRVVYDIIEDVVVVLILRVGHVKMSTASPSLQMHRCLFLLRPA